MKKLITICLLMAMAFTVKAQDMSFEETVKYINGKIACCSAYKDRPFAIEVNLSGDIKWHNPSFIEGQRINLFDLIPENKFDSPTLIQKSNGIILSKNLGSFWIDFQVSAENTKRFTWFSVQADAERVYKALQHLRTLCTKAKDPFDK